MGNYNVLPQKVLHLHIELEKKKPNLNRLYMGSEKLDGWYVTIDYINGKWYCPRSSAGRDIPSMKWVVDKLNLLPRPNFDCRFIAEAIIPGLPFHEANGIFNRSKGECQALDTVFYFHDIIKLASFWDKSDKDNIAIKRYDLLRKFDLSKASTTFELHQNLFISDRKELWMHYAEDIWDKGGEGVVLKATDSFYTPDKRNSDLMKIKLEATFDLLVGNVFWSTGEKGEECLNLLMVGKDKISQVVRVGKHSDIEKFMKESPVGKVGQIKAMKKLEDGRFREPRFQFIRWDKNPEDID